MKKQLFLFLMMLLPIIAIAETVEIDGIYYNLIPKGKVAEVTSNPNGYSGTVEIPETVTYDGVTYDVTSINGSSFNCCGGLTSISIPKSVNKIAQGAFEGCVQLDSIYITDLTAWCNIEHEGGTSFLSCNHFCLNNEEIIDLVIPNDITKICADAFYGCRGLTSVTIPSCVTAVGNNAFANCTGLISVYIPNSITTIGSYAFSGCSNLTSVQIYSLESWCKIIFQNIDANPLYFAHHIYLNGEEIKNLIIPNSLSGVANFSFAGCGGVTSVIIPNSVTDIGSGAFKDCVGLISITIANSVKSIGGAAFSGCTGLTSITIPNSVSNIEGKAFRDCSNLTSVTIGNGINNIGSHWMSDWGGESFALCPKLTDVYCYAENVSSIQSNSFKGSYIEFATLHVPASSINNYQYTTPWSGFKEIVPIEDVSLDKCATPTIVYANGELSFTCETEGVDFIYDVKVGGAKAGTGNKVRLTPSYIVSVYAAKEGYENSDVATKEITIVPGDISGDEKVDAADLTRLIDIILQKNNNTNTDK